MPASFLALSQRKEHSDSRAQQQRLQCAPGGIASLDAFRVRLVRKALVGRLPLIGVERMGRTPKLFFVHQSPRWESQHMGRTIQEADGFSQPPDSQPKSTTGNDSQQRSIPGCLGALKDPVFVDMALIRMCRDELDAVNLCIDLSHMSDEAICEHLGVDKGHWSRIRKGRAHFPTKKRLDLMYLAGNWAPLQYELDKSGMLERLKEQITKQARRDDGFSAWMTA